MIFVHYLPEGTWPVCGRSDPGLVTTGRYTEATCPACQSRMKAALSQAKEEGRLAVDLVRAAAETLAGCYIRVAELEQEMGLTHPDMDVSVRS